jgi:uncharacterized protein (AIM24 family)
MGESLFLTYFRADTPGEVGFAGHYPGRITMFDLEPGRSVLAQRDSFVVAETSVQLNVALVKKIGAGFFGGEGLFLATLRGPGRVIIQSMTLEKLRRELAPARTGGDERGPLGALGGFLGGSED